MISKRSNRSAVTVVCKFTPSLDELCLFSMPCTDRADATIKIIAGSLFARPTPEDRKAVFRWVERSDIHP